MPVWRYRSIADMPRPWRAPDDPENLRVMARLMRLHRSLMRPDRRRSVTRYRSIEEAQADREDQVPGSSPR